MTESVYDFLKSRGVEYRDHPDYVLEKAKVIIERIEAGEHFATLKGRRLTWNREMVSIQINPDYRLIAEEVGKQLKFKYVVSHSEYNKLIGRH